MGPLIHWRRRITTSRFVMRSLTLTLLSLLMIPAAMPADARGQSTAPNASSIAPAPVTLPTDYVIGVEDVLNVVFWREKDLSAEVVVRPDGKISLPMLNDVTAVGLTPEQLAANVAKAATKYVRDPGATVIV